MGDRSSSSGTLPCLIPCLGLMRESLTLPVSWSLLSPLCSARKSLDFTNAQGPVLSQEVSLSVVQHLHFFPVKLLFLVCWTLSLPGHL